MEEDNWDKIEELNENHLINNKNCSVNMIGFSADGKKKKMYRCLKCKDGGDLIICESCANKCHIGHNSFEDDTIIGNLICDCAKSSHTSVKKNTTSFKFGAGRNLFKGMVNTIKKKLSKCTLMENIKLMKHRDIYNGENGNLCPFCLIFCVKRTCSECNECNNFDHFLKKFKKIKISENEDIECNCNSYCSSDCHQPIQNLEILKNFFKSEEATKVFPKNKLMFKFLTYEKSFKYWEIIPTHNEKMLLAIKSKNFNNYRTEESIQYTKSFKILIEISKRLKINYMEIKNNNFTQEKLLEFLLEIFCSGEIRNDLFLKYKLFNLKILRRLFILPKIKYLFFDTIQPDCNTNSIHRLILLPDITELFSLTNISSQQFFSLLDLISLSIINYFNKVQEHQLNKLIKEYIKWLKILVNFKINREIQTYIINNLFKITEHIFEKRQDFLFLSHLEPLLFILMTINNDYKVLFSMKEINTEENNFRLIFQTCEYNEKLIKTLFNCVKEKLEKDEINEITENSRKYFVHRTALLDNMINENDYYSQNLQSLFKSDLKLFKKDIFLYLVNCSNNDFSLILNRDLVDLIKKIKTQIDNLKYKYFSEVIDENEIKIELCTLMTEVYNLVFEEIYLENLYLEINFYKQILIYKLGLYHSIISILRFIRLEETNLYNDSISSILGVLKVISHDNPFLIALNFNKTVVNLFFPKSKTYKKDPNQMEFNQDILDFYVDQCKILFKYNYKIEFKQLIDRIIPVIKINFDLDNPISHKIFSIFYYSMKLNIDKTIDMVKDEVSSAILSIMKLKTFQRFVNELLQETMIKEYNEELKNKHIKLISKLCKILNCLENQYFFFLTSQIKITIKITIKTKGGKRNSFRNILSKKHCPTKSYFSIIDIILIYISKMEKRSPKIIQNLLFTFYKKYFEHYIVIKKNNYYDLPCFGLKAKNTIKNQCEDCKSGKECAAGTDHCQLCLDCHDCLLRLLGQEKIEEVDEEDLIEIEMSDNEDLIFQDKKEINNKRKIKIEEKKKDKEKAISIMKKYLKNYPKIIKKHYSLFIDDVKLLFDYFANVILFPTSHLIYKYIMSSKDLKLVNIKVEIISMTLLVLECYQIFLIIVKKQFNIKNAKIIDKLILNLKKFYTKTDNLEKFLTDKLEYVKSKINELKEKDFNHLNTILVLKIYTEALGNIFYFDRLKGIQREDKNITHYEFDDFYNNLNSFIKDYNESKRIFESEDILLFKMFKNDDLKFKPFKNSVNLSLIIKFSEAETHSLTPYTEKNLIITESIVKLFKTDPEHWQVFLTSFDFALTILNNVIQSQLIYLTQPISIEFKRLNSNNNNSTYKYFLYLIEYIRLMCENHNACNQTLLFNFQIVPKKNKLENHKYIKRTEIFYLWKKKERTTFFHFLVNFINHDVNQILFNFCKEKREMINLFKNDLGQYYDPIIQKFTDLTIEMIQGTYSFNFKNFNINGGVFSYFFKTIISYFTFITLGEEIEFILSNFMRFLLAFVEENENYLENKLDVLRYINPKHLYNCFIYVVKKLHAKYFGDQDFNFLNYKLPKGASKKLEILYMTDEKFMDDPLFILSSQIYFFFKISLTFNESTSQKFKKILDELQDYSLKINDLDSSPETISNGEIFIFFNKIISNIEIFYQPKKLELDDLFPYKKLYEVLDLKHNFNQILEISKTETLGTVKKLIFIIHPYCLYLRENDILKFLSNAPYESFNVKLPYIIENISPFVDLIQTRKSVFNYSNTLFYLFTVDYDKRTNFSVILAVIVNILVFSSLFVDDLDLIQEPENFYMLIFLISLFHVVLTLFWYISFVSFNVYRLVLTTHHKVKSLSLYSKLIDYFSITFNTEIFPIFWNLVFGLLGILRSENGWIYSIQLFSITFIFPTMASVLLAVKLRYTQFLSTALLVVIFLLFYTSIAFNYFRELYYNEDLEENMCSSFFHCFLNMLNNGLRSQSIGDFSGIKSINDKFYLTHFVFQWLFFFTIVLLMVNIINGIIVDTFQQLREENNKKVYDHDNICYICNLDRSSFEIVNINFNRHKKLEHNLKNYLFYLLKINFCNELDLNSLDSFVKNAISENRMDFFPLHKSLSLEK